MVVLFGAEVSFAHQHVDDYEFEPDASTVSHAFKRLLALRIVHLLVKGFSEGNPPFSALQVAERLEIPVPLVREILPQLVASGIASEICDGKDKQPSYQPAVGTDLLTVKYVIDKLEEQGTHAIPMAESKELEKLSECLKAFGKAIEESPGNLPLKEI
jgi:membrane protein